MSQDTLVLGAVAYDAKVVPIWDGFLAYFARHGLAFDYVLYSNYERQVEAQLRGDFHVGWSSPLAWLEAERAAPRRGRTARAIAMRDTDQDLTSLIVARADGPVATIRDLRGRRLGVGATDSPQATLIPLEHVAAEGLQPGVDVEVVHHDVLVGKHGDHVGGERDAVRALLAGKVDAACLLDGNHLVFAREGVVPPGALRVIARTGAYDHCNMTVLDDAPAGSIARFTELLLAMSYDDPSVRSLLDLEGLKAWRPGRTTGYELLSRAIDRTGYLEPWLARVAA